MYTLTYDGLTVYDPRESEFSIRNTSLHLGVSDAGSFVFTMEKNHPRANDIKKITGTLELQIDGSPIYRGRVIRCSSDWNNSITVESEGVMACLNDSVISPFAFPSDFESDPDYEEALIHGNVVDYFFKWLLAQHNAQVSDEQKLLPGTVTVTDSNNYISRSTESYSTTWGVIKSKLVESALGGYLLVRYEENGTFVDYLSELPDGNLQQIEFGENLLDLSSDEDASGFFTAVLPLGKDDLTIENEPDRQLSNDLVKSGKIIYSKSARRQYGNITSIQTWSDVTNAGNLLAKAADVMLHGSGLIARTITVSACDLHLTDAEIARFIVGKKTTIISRPHGITAVYPLAELDVDILNPGSAQIKLSIDTGNDSLTHALGASESSQQNSTDRLYTELEKYYTKAQINEILTGKLSIADFGSVMAETLLTANVYIGGTLTVAGTPIDGYARFA